MFSVTFKNCSGLTGQIPAGLFGNINGNTYSGMFGGTFAGCSGLTGTIPSGLFGKFTSTPAPGMFQGTFQGCTNLTGIGDGIWDLSGLLWGNNMYNAFDNMFANCPNITTASANIAPGDPRRLWDMATLLYNEQPKTYEGSTNLADYDEIPAQWK